MSVRVNDRHLSDIEYENTFFKLNKYISSKLDKLPKRYYKHLTEPFRMALLNEYNDIVNLTNLYKSNKEISVERYRQCVKALSDFQLIIMFSYTLWNLSNNPKNNIKYIKPKSRIFWSNLVNKEMVLIIGIMNKCHKDKNLEVKVSRMKEYTKGEIKKVKFLDKLFTIQTLVYKRAILTCKNFYDIDMIYLVDLSRDAFYYAYSGNNIMVKDDNTLKKRKKYFSNAIDSLYAMNRPIRELAYSFVFTEKELEKISKLITESTKILSSLRSAENKKYENLKIEK